MHNFRRRQQLYLSENDTHFMKPKEPLLWSTRNNTSINKQTVLFYGLLTVHLSIILLINQRDVQNLVL